MTKDIELSPEDKHFWFSYIETKIGLVLPAIQQRRFEARILDRVNQYNVTSEEYFNRIKTDHEEWQSLVDDLTIAETSFFRHQSSYDLVKFYLKSKKLENIHMWSVGCSSGEEPWSLAMLAKELTDNFKIMATDVSQLSVNQASKGVYNSRRLEILPPGFKTKYFEHFNSTETETLFSVSGILRKHVSFYKHNLVGNTVIPFRGMDIIFCQNVLIYFRNFIQRDILNTLVKSLSVGGLLIMAPAEARSWKHPDMERVNYQGTLAFKRVK